MPTTDQLAARARALALRQKLDTAERAILSVATTLAALRDGGADTKPLEQELSGAISRRDALGAMLTKARELSLAGADALGADLLDAALPVLLLPLRLETRYEKDLLRVRIYPDDVHRDSHEPPLTRTELDAYETYLKALDAATDRPPWLAAWSELVARVGMSRALHVATLDDAKSVGQRPGPWSRAVVARLLPDRFVAYAWTDGGAAPVRALASAAVREPLALGPDPFASDAADTTPLGETARWLHDYDEALRAGMAIDVPLGRPDVGVERLVVLGVRASVDAQAQAAELEALLGAHHRTSGLGLLAPGSATNALDGTRPKFTSRADAAAAYDRELSYRLTGGTRKRREPLYMVRHLGGLRRERTASSFALAEALGIDALTLGHVEGGDDSTIADETAARELIRSAFASGVARAVAPGLSPDAVATTFEHFVGEISALGPYATLLVGSQPYGVLPLMAARRAPMDPFGAGLHGLLDALRSHAFADAVEGVPRVGNAAPGDPGATLVQLLRSEGIARHLRVRGVVGPELADAVAAELDTGRSGVSTQRASVVDLLERLGLPDAGQSALARMILLSESAPITRPLVVPAEPAAAETPSIYLGWLRTLPLTAILAEQYPAPRPAAVLFDIARSAVLLAADADARRTLVDAGGVDPSAFEDPNSGVGSITDRLYAPAPLDPITTLAQRLRLPGVPEAREIARTDAALAHLAGVPVAALEVLLGGTLGLLSHRLDAWYTGFATQRLRELRANLPPAAPAPDGFRSGIGAGAYGWLERIPRRGAGACAGYVHAPSAQHAAAAGVLLSVDTAHRASGHGGAFAVDLSSARVRAALELLEGVRAGQALEALVGYRIERALVAAGGTAPALIARLRDKAPLIAHRLTPGTEPAANVAASNVVDGLALLRLATADGTQPALVARLPDIAAAADAAQRKALEAALATAADAVDAVGDLVIAESVFHLVGGQPGRAGAATDVLAGTLVPPPEADVVSTPLRGIATTHRVFIALDPGASRGGWSTSPRAQAEPGVDAWVATLLAPPGAIRLLGDFRDGDGQVVSAVDATLADLLAAAHQANRAELALSALDVVLGSLEPRIAPLLELRRPAAAQDATLELRLERDASFGPQHVSVAELALVAADLRALIGPARALRPDDLPFGASVAAAELGGRLASATNAVTTVRDHLAAATTDAARVRALLAADHLGVEARIDPMHLAEQVAAARKQLVARLASAGEAGKSAAESLRALFGPTLPVVPRLALDDDDAAAAFGEDVGATPAEVRAFLERGARVRARLALLRAVLGHADALRGTSSYQLHVAQRPRRPGERWSALSGPVAGGRTSLVAVGGSTLPGTGRELAGLFVDDWVEVIPLPHADTSVVFHLSAPSAAAPNALLLCVPEATRETWSEADLLAHVLEARELARLRAVDPDGLGVAAHILPALLADDTAFGASLGERLSDPAEATR